ncbi:hypothetical protein Tco_1313489 [Tanacetum coccineum]
MTLTLDVNEYKLMPIKVTIRIKNEEAKWRWFGVVADAATTAVVVVLDGNEGRQWWGGNGWCSAVAVMKVVVRGDDDEVEMVRMAAAVVTPRQWRKHGMRRYRSSHKIQDHTLYNLQK